MTSSIDREHLLGAGLVALAFIGIAAAGLLLAPYTAPVSATVGEGDSMGYDGQMVVVHSSVGVDDPQVGDVVVFEMQQQVFYHRIVDETDEGFITKGDANAVADQHAENALLMPVAQHEIYGQGLVVVPLNLVLGGLLAVLAALGLGAAALYRRQLAAGLRRVRAAASRLDDQMPRLRQIVTVSIIVVLVASGIGPFASFGGHITPDHEGTVVAAEGDEIWSNSTANSPDASSPTIVNGTVYIGAGGTVRAYDADTGNEKWVFSGGNIPGAPTVVGDTVYAAGSTGSGEGRLYAINATDGTQRWEYDVGAVDGSPTYANGTVYMGSRADDRLLAIDADTGNLEWTFGVGEAIMGSPTISDGTVYFGSHDDNLYAVDTATGNEEWNYTAGGNVRSSPTVANGIVYSAGSDFFAVDKDTGAEEFVVAGGGYGYQSPTFWDGTVYMTDNSGNITAMDASTGEKEWVYETGTGTDSSPTVAGGTVYVGTDGNKVLALDASTGTQDWSFSTGGVVKSSPTVTDGTLYVGSNDNQLYAIDTGHSKSSEGSRVYHGTLGHNELFPADGSTYSLGEPVSITVTDPDGNALDSATVEAVNTSTGNTAASGTTDASGAVELSVDTGEYDITASKSGYASETETVDVPSGGTSVDFALQDNVVAGQVVEAESGDPVADATVRVYAVNYSKADIASDTDAEDVLQQATNAQPANFTSQVDSSFSLSGSGSYLSEVDSEVALLHTRDSIGVASLSLLGDNADLSTPRWQNAPADERLLVTCRDPAGQGGILGSGVAQGEYDQQNVGTVKEDCRVEITQLAGADEIGMTTVRTNRTHSSGRIDPSKLHYGTVSLPDGWYHLQVKDSDASYVARVGSPTQAIVEDLTTADGTPAAIAQHTSDALNDNTFVTKTTTTNADGQYSIQITDSSLNYVGVQAYKHPGSDVDPANLSFQQIRSDADAGSLEGSVYMPSRVRKEPVPTTGTTLEVREVGWPAYGNLSEFQSQWQAYLNTLKNGSFSQLPPALQQRLDNQTGESLEETYAELDKLREQNARLEDQYTGELRDSSDGTNVEVNIDPNQTSDQELRQRIQALQQSLTELQGTIEAGQPESSTGQDTVSLSFPFDAELEPDNVVVRAHYNNGTTRILSPDSEYVSVDSRVGRGDAVTITDYPMGEGDAAVADFEVDVATSEGTGGASETVTNPTFSGTIPSLTAVEFSTLRPGPSETVNVGVTPEESAKYGSLVDTTVYAPNGSTLTTSNITDDAFSFTTAGAGPHRVELTFTNPGGVEFTEVVNVQAGETAENWPASVRTKSGPTGVYALVGDGLESGAVEVEEGGSQVDVAATIPQNADTPGELHVYTAGLETAPDATTTVSVVRGSEQASVQKNVPVTIHGPTIPEDALVYRNGEPLPRDGNQYGQVTADDNQTRYETITSDDGSVDIRVSASPGFVERALYTVQTTIPDIGVLGTFAGIIPDVPLGGPAVGGFVVVGVGTAAAHRRR